MKYPVDNITVEGQGWNRYAIAAEGEDAFTKRVLKDGHYQRDSDGMGLTDEQRTEIAKTVYKKAADFVASKSKQLEPAKKEEKKS